MPATQYNVGFDDAESVNQSKRSNFLYKDLNLNFSRNPVTADVATVTDAQDVKRAVRNLVLLNPGEKPFHPEIGTGIRSMLFELVTPPVIQTMKNRIKFFNPRPIFSKSTRNTANVGTWNGNVGKVPTRSERI